MAWEPTLPGRKGAHSAKAKPSKAQRRARVLWLHRGVRWAVQVGFFLLAPAMFSAAFNGVKYLFTQIGAGEAVQAGGFIVLLVALLGFTALFGRFFCGYACAFGTLGDAVYAVFTPVRRLLRIPEKPLPPAAMRAGQFVKFGVLAGVCALCLTGTWSAVSGYSPWTAFAAGTEGSLEGAASGALAALVLVMLGMAVVERFFCQFLCPLGALFALMPMLPCSLFTRRKERCAKSCGLCQKSCLVSLYPDADAFASGECIACGRCADTCPLENISLISVGAQSANSGAAAGGKRGGKPKLQVRGTGVAGVFVRAALLLAVFWLAGALTSVPSFTELTGIALPWQG